jgi:Cu(I)/Ag(I) efflux system membrane fusion protein
MGQVHVGQHVSVSPSALPDVTEQGTVNQIIPQADPQTDTFDTWVAVVNKDRKLVPGMSAFVHIETSGQALVLPRLAVLDSETDPKVFVAGKDQRAHLRYVHVVGRSTQSIFVNSGLAAGDRVVLLGLDGLQDGQIIRVTKIYE